MNAEEAKFHQKWYKIFLDIDRNTVGGIGFDPKSVPQYTPQNVAEFMKLYKYNKRLTFSPVLKGAIKTAYTTFIWGLVVVGTGSFGIHKYFEIHLDDLHEEKAALTKELEGKTNALAAERKVLDNHRKRNARLTFDFDKQTNDLDICTQRTKALEASVVAQQNKIKSESDKVCSSATKFSVDATGENTILATTYSKGIPFKCKIILNERIINCMAKEVWYKRKGIMGISTTYCGYKETKPYKIIGLKE